MSSDQRNAVARHRERLHGRGLVRLEVLAPQADAALLREIAGVLRDDPAGREKVRSNLRQAIARQPERNILDLLADESELDLDEYIVRRRDLGRDVGL